MRKLLSGTGRALAAVVECWCVCSAAGLFLSALVACCGGDAPTCVAAFRVGDTVGLVAWLAASRRS